MSVVRLQFSEGERCLKAAGKTVLASGSVKAKARLRGGYGVRGRR